MEKERVQLFVPIDENEREKIDKEYEEQKKELYKKNKKKYYALMIAPDDDETKTWEKFIGRDSIVDFLEEAIKNEEIDVEKSLVLIEDLPIGKSLNVYKFMKEMQECYDHGFDIENYI